MPGVDDVIVWTNIATHTLEEPLAVKGVRVNLANSPNQVYIYGAALTIGESGVVHEKGTLSFKAPVVLATNQTWNVPVSGNSLNVADLSGPDCVLTTTGSGNVWSHSEAQRVAIADPPSCEVAMPATIEAQGTALTVSTDAKLPRLHVALVASGVTHETPVGTVAQAEGDVVAEAEPSVEWQESGGLMVAIVRLPDSDEIYDGGEYTLRATVTDEATGLSSSVATASATVAWSHQPGRALGHNRGRGALHLRGR